MFRIYRNVQCLRKSRINAFLAAKERPKEGLSSAAGCPHFMSKED